MEDKLICLNCKKEIDTNEQYMRFAGDNLHTDCLIEYMQRLKVLVIMNPRKSGGQHDGQS